MSPSKKAAKAPRPIISEPRIVVFKEKHGEAYYVAKTDEDLFKISLKVLRDRFASGYFYSEPDKKDPAPLGFDAKDVEGMPESLRASGRLQLEMYNNRLVSLEDERRAWKDMVSAIKEGNGREAWRILHERGDHEYEGISLERIEKFDE